MRRLFKGIPGALLKFLESEMMKSEVKSKRKQLEVYVQSSPDSRSDPPPYIDEPSDHNGREGGHSSFFGMKELGDLINPIEGWEIDKKLIDFDEEGTVSVCGQGTFGIIKTGECKVGISSIKVAVKMIKIEDDIEVVKREITTMSKLNHPNVLKCFGGYLSEDRKHVFVCLPYCKAGDLRQHLIEVNKMEIHVSSKEKIDFCLQLSRGMSHLHSSGFVHRDLKPSNILLTDDLKYLMITDFGNSRLIDDVGGTLCGSPSYVPPEMIHRLKEKHDPKLIDIYAFGILIWVIWTGRVMVYPHLEKKFKTNAYKFMLSIHGNAPNTDTIERPDLSVKELEDMPEDFMDLMVQCWDENPSKRPKSFANIVDELSFFYNDMTQEKMTSDMDDTISDLDLTT